MLGSEARHSQATVLDCGIVKLVARAAVEVINSPRFLVSLLSVVRPQGVQVRPGSVR